MDTQTKTLVLPICPYCKIASRTVGISLGNRVAIIEAICDSCIELRTTVLAQRREQLRTQRTVKDPDCPHGSTVDID